MPAVRAIGRAGWTSGTDAAALKPPAVPDAAPNHAYGVTPSHPASEKAANRQSGTVTRQAVMEMDREDRPVLVTGATGSTGRAVVDALMRSPNLKPYVRGGRHECISGRCRRGV